PEAWLCIIRRALGLPAQELSFERLPAIGRVTISSPAVMRAVAKLNVGKKYRDKLKPFNFLLTCYVKQFGYPLGVNPERFHLVAPYELDPSRWLEMPWIDQYTGKPYQITTVGFHANRQAARVKTYGDVLREYEFHPGSKSADAKGKPSGKQTTGLLQGRHSRVERIIYDGKESNRLEEVESGTIHSAQSVYTEYPDPRRDEWQTKIMPALKMLPVAALMKLSRKSQLNARENTSRTQPTTPQKPTIARIHPSQTRRNLAVCLTIPVGMPRIGGVMAVFNSYLESICGWA